MTTEPLSRPRQTDEPPAAGGGVVETPRFGALVLLVHEVLAAAGVIILIASLVVSDAAAFLVVSPVGVFLGALVYGFGNERKRPGSLKGVRKLLLSLRALGLGLVVAAIAFYAPLIRANMDWNDIDFGYASAVFGFCAAYVGVPSVGLATLGLALGARWERSQSR
ncbi:MAG TPA: hypothetical protein VEB43_17510 [Anaeromyxobacter sp.]|nr:hypothetical protein [Anaeromyxobacter sp.]